MTKPEPTTREAILAAIDDLPPFPPVAARLLELLDDPDSSAADIARAISRDQALAAKVLRIGNSSFYGFAQQVTSLPQAVVVLGLRTVRDLVLLDSLPLRSRGKSMTAIEKELWVHSVGAAFAARFLAMRGSWIDSDAAFLCGLFHDVGQLLLNQLAPQAYGRARQQMSLGLSTVEAEMQTFGIAHTEVGAEAFVRWELPGPAGQVALQHHEDPAGLDALTRVIRAADDFMHWQATLLSSLVGDGQGAAAEEEMMAVDDAYLPNRPGSAGQLLGLTDEDLTDLTARLKVALEKETRFFLSAA
ncbi:MAG: HDOD domain-containing protein [Candidatus Eisenbacteria bacterium]